MAITSPNHVAILVPSVKKAAEYLRRFDFKVGDAEDFEGEGTREVYVEFGRANSLLLMEPIKQGAYQRALDKRGPGFHHFAIDVLNLENYLISLVTSGWLLHPASIETIKKSQTAYLARPGFHGLIEVQQKSVLNEEPPFVREVGIKMDPSNKKLLMSVGLDSIIKIEVNNKLVLGDHVVELQKLWANNL
jgi:hypothetical protein